ncbi:hypothetical protein QJS10_CPA03g02024 [Acorus calamus]|uniref:Uncharacterized protein n=1 Tax=Acorus calamus TaxID=4465 RepID=A0AAV9F5R0_ACOCL|nr:hypothetical protein QJS10_CPA03g02024 [Acorus calamus]
MEQLSMENMRLNKKLAQVKAHVEEVSGQPILTFSSASSHPLHLLLVLLLMVFLRGPNAADWTSVDTYSVRSSDFCRPNKEDFD